MNRSNRTPPSRRRRMLFVCMAVSLSCITLIAAIEVVIRLTRSYHTPETKRAESLQYRPAVFSRHRLKPNQRVMDEGHEIIISRIGYREPALELAKAPGKIRVIFVGGSMVFTVHVRNGEDWPSLVQERLRELGHSNVEVLNAGVAGHASFDALGRFYSELWRYRPDYVVICNAWNDIKYFVELNPRNPLLRWSRPYRPDRDPRLNYQNSADRLLSRSSQLYVRLRRKYYDIKLDIGKEGANKPRELADSYPPDGPAQYRMNMALFADAARNAGAVPVFLTQPTLAVLDLPEPGREEISYKGVGLAHDALVRAFEECRAIVLEVAREKEAPVLDLHSRMSGESGYFDDHVHTTRRGNEKLAELVGDFLSALLSSDSRGPALAGENEIGPGR